MISGHITIGDCAINFRLNADDSVSYVVTPVIVTGKQIGRAHV